MRELRDDLRLAVKPPEGRIVGIDVAEDLERDLPPEVLLLCEEHQTAAPLGEGAEQPVTADDPGKSRVQPAPA